MGLFGSKSKSKSKSKSSPWEPQQPYLLNAFKWGDEGYQSSAPNAETMDAWEGISQRALAGSPLTRQAQNYTGRILSGEFLNQQTPNFQFVANRARQAADSTYAAAGRYGSGAHDAAVAGAIGELSYGDYANQLSRMDQAAQLAPQLANQDYFDWDKLQQVGDQKRYDQLNRAAQYLALVSGNYGGVTTSTSKQKDSQGIGNQLFGLGQTLLNFGLGKLS